MGPSTATISKLLREVNGAVELKAAIVQNIKVESFEICWNIDNTNIAGLDKVIGDEKMLLIRRHLYVVRADCWLVLIRIIEALNIVQVADIEGGNVVSLADSCVEVFSVLGKIGARSVNKCRGFWDGDLLDGHHITSLRAKIVKKFGNTLIAICIFAERVDDPDLAKRNRSCYSSTLRVARNEFYILNATTLQQVSYIHCKESRTYVGNGDGADDLPGLELPQPKSVSILDA